MAFLRVFDYQDLLKSLVARDLKVRYKGTFLGFFWSFLNPLLNLLVLSVVFSFVIRTGVENYPIFLLIGILSWQFLSMSLTLGARSIVDNGDLIKKVYLAKEVFPLSVVLGSLVHLFFALIVLLFFLLYFNIFPSIPWILFPYFLFLFLLFATGLAFILSSLSVYFRDIPPLIESVLPAWYFASPVIYPPSFIPERFQFVYSLNPMAAFLTAFREIILNGVSPSKEVFLITITYSLIFLFVGYFIFRKLEKKFAEEI